jgi:hypothetical protein
MPPSFIMFFGRVDRLLDLQLKVVEDTMPLLVTLEKKSLLLVSFTLLNSWSTKMAMQYIRLLFEEARPMPLRLLRPRPRRKTSPRSSHLEPSASGLSSGRF